MAVPLQTPRFGPFGEFHPDDPIGGLPAPLSVGQQGLTQRIQQGMPAPPTAPRTAPAPAAMPATPVDPGWSDVNEFQQTRPNMMQRAGRYVPMAGALGDYERAVQAQGLGQATKSAIGGLARRFLNR